MKPLFIPLKKEYFEAFERGEKAAEYRTYGPRWNEKTCAVGRSVTLSCGYGTQRRLTGRVVSFAICATPQLLPGWNACFGDAHFSAAVIGIEIVRREAVAPPRTDKQERAKTPDLLPVENGQKIRYEGKLLTVTALDATHVTYWVTKGRRMLSHTSISRQEWVRCVTVALQKGAKYETYKTKPK